MGHAAQLDALVADGVPVDVVTGLLLGIERQQLSSMPGTGLPGGVALRFGPHLVHLGGLLCPVESANSRDVLRSLRRNGTHEAEDAGRHHRIL